MPLVFGKDYLTGDTLQGAMLAVDAPLVFVGFGLVAPEHGRDDYAGLDVKGKIVVALSGAPKFLQTEERAYYRSGRVKLKAALDHGAVGFVSIGTRTGEKLYPFANNVRQYKSWGMTWRRPTASPSWRCRCPAWPPSAWRGRKNCWARRRTQILDAAETRDGAIKGFDLPLSLKAEAAYRDQDRRKREHRRHAARQRSQAERRICRALRASGPYRHHPAGEWRQHQQWRAGQCLWCRHHPGSGAAAQIRTAHAARCCS